MINSVEFTDRLKKVIDFYNETASSFAEKIGVQRSSISHILSGRNKPSLDFVMKVLHSYPEVELYWLMNGKGEFPNNTKQVSPPTFKPETKIPKIETSNSDLDLASDQNIISDSDIEKIVIFYKNGTFKSYTP